MVLGFLLMLVGLLLLGLARSTKDEDQPRFTGKLRLGLFSGGGVMMALGVGFCVIRFLQWKEALGGL